MSFKRRTARHVNSFGYGQLENRQLLAIGDFAEVVDDASLAAGFNLIVNSNFQTAVNGVNREFNDADVAGWKSISSGSGKMRIFDFNSGGHGNVLELDFAADQLDGIYQDISAEPGQSCLISFDLRNSVGPLPAPAQTNDVEVFWNGESIGTFSGRDYFRTVKLVAVFGIGLTSRLEFRERVGATGPGNDGVGPLLDNVRVVKLANNILANGSFETVTGTGTIFPYTNVPGWNAWGPTGQRTLGIGQGGAASGDRFLNLDSSNQNINRVLQELATRSDANYVVRFNAKLDPTATDDSNQIRLRWGDDWVGTITPTADWRSYYLIVHATSAENQLVFREAGSFGDGFGPWIDNIQVYRAAENSELSIDLNGPGTGTGATANFVEDGGAASVLNSNLVLTNQSAATLSGAKIVLKNPIDGPSEVLGINTAGTSITATFNNTNKVLTLTGNDSIANYKKVLATLTYLNNSQNPDVTQRIIEISIEDEGNFGNKAVLLVNVQAINDAPIITPLADTTASAGNLKSIQVSVTDPDSTSLTYTISSTGTALASGETGPTISSTGKIEWTPTQSGKITVTVKVRDSLLAESTEVLEITSLLDNLVPSNFVPFSGTRQLSFVRTSLRDDIYSAAPAMTIDTSKDYKAIISTDFGDITLDLFDNLAPKTVNNFVNLARDGFYDGLIFHRVINIPTNRFVAQGGDPRGTGSGGPGYQFADEFTSSLTFAEGGMLAMANSGPATNGSQFFITYSPQTHLNNKHSIFGKLVSGSAALNSLSQNGSGAIPTNPSVIRKVTIVET